MAGLAFLLVCTSLARAMTFTVSNNADSGAGSLRQAILDANGNAGPDQINFAGPLSIHPLSALPMILEALELDATGQLVDLDASGLPPDWRSTPATA